MTTWNQANENSSSLAYANKASTTWTKASTPVDYEMLIGDGFFLNIGDGFRLLIDGSDLPTWNQASKN